MSPPPLSPAEPTASRRAVRRALGRADVTGRPALLVLLAATVLGVGGARISEASAAPLRSAAELTAQQHFKEGEQRYAARQFQAALDEYQAGFSILPLPGFLVNIGQCYRRMGDLVHARSTFQRFVLAAPDSPLLPEIRDLIAEIDRQQRSAYLDTPEVLPLSYGNGESEEPERGAHAHLDEPGPILSASALRARPPTHGAGAPPQPTGAIIDLRSEAEATEARAGAHSSDEDEPSASAAANHRWWLWGGLAAAVIAGSVTAYLALSAPNTVVLHDGTLGSLRR